MENCQRLIDRLPDELDAALLECPRLIRWAIGFDCTTATLLVTKKKPILFVDFRYYEKAKRQFPFMEIRKVEKPFEALTNVLNAENIKILGLSASQTSLKRYQKLREVLQGFPLDTSPILDDLLTSLRMVKTPIELKNMQEAQRLTDSAFTHILSVLSVGISEKSIAAELECFLRKNGAEAPSFSFIVASGVNSALPHASPGEKVLQKGDFVTLDFGCIFEGYCSDMTRTVSIGKPGDEMETVYNTVLKAQQKAFETIQTGIPCCDVDLAARNFIDGAGFQGAFGHSLGHSLGIEIHEEPRFSASCNILLEENMILTVEPGIYLEGKFGVRIEDVVIIQRDGYENITKSPKELLVL